MARTRALNRFAIAFAVACLAWAGVMMVAMPVASADTLPNGYDVSCKANGSNTICSIAGCPRVYENYAGDVVHIKIDGGPQSEPGHPCGSTTTHTVNNASAFTLSIQGCRKHDF